MAGLPSAVSGRCRRSKLADDELPRSTPARAFPQGGPSWELRERAEKADKRADEAEKVAEENRDEATKGRALATSVQAEDKARQPRGRRGIAPMGGNEEESEDSTLRRHAELARSLFGDLV